MARYRRKMCIVEAVQWTANNFEEIREFAENSKSTIV